MAEPKYEIAEDGLVREIVGSWAQDKHDRLRRYIDISRHVRRKFLEGKSGCASYIELFSGTGQGRVRDTKTVIDGSPVAAFKIARDGRQPFSEIHLGDVSEEFVAAAGERIRRLGGAAKTHVGQAEDAARIVVRSLDNYGLHFALLDPYKLESLSFDLLKALSQLRNIDMLLHVSQMDLQRNLDAYGDQDEADLDRFAPGWRSKVDLKSVAPKAARAAILEHWCGLVQELGFNRPFCDLITGSKNQPLYWLAFISRHPKAHEFWQKIRYTDGQDDLLSGF